jgi:hypothetical protein
VKQRQQRMEYDHARPGKAHDPLDLLAHLRLEAMDGAPCARRLILAVGAPANALQRIVQQKPAIIAHQVACPVVSATVQPDHAFDRLLFPAKPARAGSPPPP